jgi:tetratricopeptide (TPR) repeat protein
MKLRCMMLTVKNISLALVLVFYTSQFAVNGQQGRGGWGINPGRATRGISDGFTRNSVGRSGRIGLSDGRLVAGLQLERSGARRSQISRPRQWQQATSKVYRPQADRYHATYLSSRHHRGFHHRFHFSYYPRSYVFFGLPYYRYYYPYPAYYYYPEPYYGYVYDDYKPAGSQPQPYVGADTFRDVREKLERQKAVESALQERVSHHLDNIAGAFADSDFTEALSLASQAVQDEPDSSVLRFVHSQCLFAAGEFDQAAIVLRDALAKSGSEQARVFYSPGLYPDQDILAAQISDLIDAAAQAEPFDAHLQLLLGYQLLGIGRYEDALEALEKARLDYMNKDAAELLIDALEKAQQQKVVPAPNEADPNS